MLVCDRESAMYVQEFKAISEVCVFLIQTFVMIFKLPAQLCETYSSQFS